MKSPFFLLCSGDFVKTNNLTPGGKNNGNNLCQKREDAMKAKQLRRLGFIPANVFGKSLPDPISIQLKENDARKLIRQKHEGSKLTLDVDGTRLLVQIKEKAIDSIKGEIQYISFQTLTADEKVNSVIHILLANDDKVSGQLEKMLMEIPYASLPGDMIDTLTIDMDGITTGTVLMVKDIPKLMSDKLELKIDPEEIVLRFSERRNYAEASEAE